MMVSMIMCHVAVISMYNKINAMLQYPCMQIKQFQPHPLEYSVRVLEYIFAEDPHLSFITETVFLPKEEKEIASSVNTETACCPNT